MRPASRYVIGALGAIAMFAVGRASRSERAPTSVDTSPARGAGDTPTCIDRPTLAANANLVDQVTDYRRRVDRVREEVANAAKAGNADASSLRGRLLGSPDDWRRMARDRTIRVRVPCDTWSSGGTFSISRAGHPAGITVAASMASERAEASGLSEAELQALGEAYDRARARTWTEMRPTCEKNDAYRKLLAERDEKTALDDAFRVSTCLAATLDVEDPAARSALQEVAALRARGAGSERAGSDVERIAFALTNATGRLAEEMIHSLGVDAATRALDHGIVCFEETVYDLREGGEPATETTVSRTVEPADVDEVVD